MSEQSPCAAIIHAVCMHTVRCTHTPEDGSSGLDVRPVEREVDLTHERRHALDDGVAEVQDDARALLHHPDDITDTDRQMAPAQRERERRYTISVNMSHHHTNTNVCLLVTVFYT